MLLVHQPKSSALLVRTITLKCNGENQAMTVELQSKASLFNFISLFNKFILILFSIGYNIERREKDSKKWKKLNKDLIKVLKPLFSFLVFSNLILIYF